MKLDQALNRIIDVNQEYDEQTCACGGTIQRLVATNDEGDIIYEKRDCDSCEISIEALDAQAIELDAL